MNIPIPDEVKKAVSRIHSRVSVASRTLFSTIVEKLPSSFVRDEGGLLGGIMMVMVLLAIVGFFLVMMGAIEWIVREIAESVHLIGILVHVPQIEVGGMWFPGAVDIPADWSFIHAATSAGGGLYSTFQTISFAVLTIGFVMIGLSYVLEQFNVMQQGTAENLLSESVLILVLIFIFPYFYNASAVALNAVNEDMILSTTVPQDANSNFLDETGKARGDPVPPEDISKDIATAAGTAPAVISGLDTPLVGMIPSTYDPSKIITVLVTMTASFMAVLIAFSTGLFKVIATVGLAAAFPFILAMRLIPFLKSVSRRLTSSLIGLMLASLVIAIFFRIGWEILAAIWADSAFTWGVGVALLMAAAGAFTITAPAMSGMSAEISGTLGRSTAAATGGMVATGITGGMGAAVGAGAGGGKALMKGGGGKDVGEGALRGFAMGGAAGAPGRDIVGSTKAGFGAGKEGGVKALTEAPGEQAGVSSVSREGMVGAHGQYVEGRVDDVDPNDIQAGRDTKRAIEHDNLNEKEAYALHASLRERASPEKSWNKGQMEAEMEHGEIKKDEITQGLNDGIAHMKDNPDELGVKPENVDKHIDAALGKLSKESKKYR